MTSSDLPTGFSSRPLQVGDLDQAVALYNACSQAMIGANAFTPESVLAVRKPWRKRGLGLALVQHSFVDFFKRGKARVGLGVDAANLTGATRLYEKAGMRASRQFDVYKKERRAGVEMSKR